MRLTLLDLANKKHVDALRSLHNLEDTGRFLLSPPRPDMPYLVFLIQADDGRILGSVDIYNIDLRLKSAEFGLWTKDAPVGTGARAARKALRLLFDSTPVKRVQASIRKSNHEAIVAAGKFGFVLEGCLRKAADGENILVFGLLADEFRARWQKGK